MLLHDLVERALHVEHHREERATISADADDRAGSVVELFKPE